MKTRIFPDLKGKKWAEVDLGALAVKEFPETAGPNKLLDPQFCDDWVVAKARERGADFTYGGYLEDRAHLWRGSYLPPGTQLHLGIDYNVPAGTRVAACADGEVTHIIEQGIEGGWGGLVVLKLTNPPLKAADYLYYGHLAWDGTVKVGQKVKAGDIVGHIGLPHQNGVWFPHLHVQLVSQAQMDKAGGVPELVDGYMQPPVPRDEFADPGLLIDLS